MHNAETKAPPSQEPRDHRVQAARATFSQIQGCDPKASNDAVMWHLESRKRSGETLFRRRWILFQCGVVAKVLSVLD